VVACSLCFVCFIVSKHIHSCLSSEEMNARDNKLTGTIPQGVGLLSLLGTFFTDGHLTRGVEFLLSYALTFLLSLPRRHYCRRDAAPRQSIEWNDPGGAVESNTTE
jgi:hypothetical protein